MSTSLTSPEYTMSEITRVAAEVLGYADASELDPGQPLGELGFDSMMSVRLRNALLPEGIDLPLYLINGGPSVSELAAYAMRNAVEEQEEAVSEAPLARYAVLTHIGAAVGGLVVGIALVFLFANLFPGPAHDLIPPVEQQVQRTARGRGF